MASWAHSSNVLRLTKLLLTSVFSVNRTEKEDVFFFSEADGRFDYGSFTPGSYII